MVLWPEAIPRLKAIRDHWSRRLHRMELLATESFVVREGRPTKVRVDHEVFPEIHAYLEGLRDGTIDALKVLEDERVMPMPLDLAIVELVKGGATIDEISEQCGCTVREVAEILARLARGESTEEPS